MITRTSVENKVYTLVKMLAPNVPDNSPPRILNT